MKRRANGDGSITHRKDGRWMGRYYITRPDGTRKREQIVLKDRSAVVTRMREEMALAEKGTPILRDNRTVGEYLEYWLTHISAPRVRKSTQHARAHFVRHVIIPEIGDVKLAALKPENVLQMLSQLRAKGKSLDMQKRAKQLLSTVLKDAMKYGIVHRNVTLAVDTPKHKPKERNVWDKRQVHHFLAYAKSINHRFYPLFEFLLYYGPRCGESLGLRWQDVNFGNDTIHIKQSMTTVGNERVFDVPKTEAGIRDLPLLPNIRKTLLEHRAKEPHYADDLVFHGRNGKPVDRRSLLRTFKRLARQAGLTPITLHETRHTVGTLLKESGVSPKDAQTILGHSDIATTLQIYTHSNAASKTLAMNAYAANLTAV